MLSLSIVLLPEYSNVSFYFDRPKHPVNVHVWAGISWQGPTPCIIFEGSMNATGFIEVLEAGLKPFMANTISNPQFMQDNNPKHSSRRVGMWLQNANVNWWRTPPESPDLNPIENLWHEVKEYLRREIKPRTKKELIDGINQFWDTVDVSTQMQEIHKSFKESGTKSY
jgi:hypothetical protein